MPSVRLKVSPTGMERIRQHIDTLIERSVNTQPLMEEIGQYLVNSVRHRIYSSKTDPSGQKWPELKPSTREIRKRRGFLENSILLQSGELANSVQVTQVSDRDVTVAATVKYASYMQRGVKQTGGVIKGKTVPPRPFMGISTENTRRIARMVTTYLERGEVE